MQQVNMFEAKTNLSKMAKALEDGEQDYFIIAKNGVPFLRLTLEKKANVKNRIGVAKGKIKLPDDLLDWDFSEDFEGDIF